jgi:hypothetical protein
VKGYTAKGTVWQLRNGDEIVADLVVDDEDWPWVYSKLQTRPGFDALRPLFAHELTLLDDIENNVDEWEAAYDKIRSALTLLYPDGTQVPEYLLHVKNDDVWWRWNDQPFEE